MFTFERCGRDMDGGDTNGNDTLTPQRASLIPESTEERMGFIMFEAGLENIAIKYDYNYFI